MKSRMFFDGRENNETETYAERCQWQDTKELGVSIEIEAEKGEVSLLIWLTEAQSRALAARIARTLKEIEGEAGGS